MMFDETPEIECPDCDGRGYTLSVWTCGCLHKTEEVCEACNGHGWRVMTDDEEADAAEEQHRLMMEEDAPMSMQEAYERAWQQKQELRS